MAEKPENRFINLVHSKMHKDVYYEKMNNPYRSGTPDVYYEGKADILWVEYKWIPKPWSKDLLPEEICSTKSWIAQRNWLKRAYDNGVNAVVIVGIGSGRLSRGYILHYPFSFNSKVSDYPVSTISSWIWETVTQC